MALATPYIDEVHERAIGFLEENGHRVVTSDNLGIDSDHALAEVPLEEVYDLVCAVDHADASAVFVSCTNFRSVGAIAALETRSANPLYRQFRRPSGIHWRWPEWRGRVLVMGGS